MSDQVGVTDARDEHVDAVVTPDPAPDHEGGTADGTPDVTPGVTSGEPGGVRRVRPGGDTSLRSALTSTLGDLVLGVRAHPGARHPATRRTLRALGRVAVLIMIAAVGGSLGAALAPATTAYVGPLTAQLRVVPSLHPGVTVLLPPAGRVEFDTHVGPLAVEARVSEVDLEGAKDLIASPGGLLALERSGPEALRSAAIHAAVVTSGCALAGAVLLSLLWYRRRWLRTVEVAGAMVGLLVVSGAVTAVSFDADRFAGPRFSGLLSQAPYVAGSATSLLDRLESYRSGLADIVQGVTSLYATAGGLTGSPATGQGDVTTVLHVSDIHLNPLAFDLIDRLVEQFHVDVVVDTGDIVTWGTAVENPTVARIGDVPVPYVYVRGNHDSDGTQRAVAANKNAVVLDDAVREVSGLTVAGIGDPRFTPDGEPVAVSAVTQTPTVVAQGDALDGSAGESGEGGAAGPGDTGVLERADPEAPPVVTDVEQEAAGQRLAATVDTWNATRPQQPVQVAAVHEPTAIGPLLGRVPLVLAGHTHQRSVRLDPSGTLIMTEGSTGGAGITSSGLQRLTDGAPLPLSATLIYLARTGPRRGHVVAYDEVTMGGFGLSSVTLQRHVVRAEQERPLVPPTPAPGAPTPTPTSAPTSVPSSGPAPTTTTRR